MKDLCRYFSFLIVFLHVSGSSNKVSADCESYWLSQYEDVLPSINSRPNFPAALEREFQETHFGRSNGAEGMALCHVMAWFDIRCRLDILFEEAFNAEKESAETNDENYTNLRDFLLTLFSHDYESVVNFGAWYPPLTFEAWDKPNDPWYEQTPFVRTFVGDYMNGDLEVLRDEYELNALSLLESKNSDENVNFWRESHEDDPDTLILIRKQNAKAIKELLGLANASPSNLRYGDGSSNSGISQEFDPMGDAIGQITQKEIEMLEKYVISYDPEEFNGQYYLRSSTGVHQSDTKSMNHWYIRCLRYKS